jgi:uncharacterized coiled-coil DUF342 family protein
LARGKNKAIAERRNQALSEINSIESQRIQIRNLNTTIEELREEIRTKDTLHKKSIAKLNAQLKHNTSDLVEEVQARSSYLLAELGEANKVLNKIQDNWSKVFINLRTHYVSSHKMSFIEALENTTQMLGDDPHDAITVIEGISSGVKNLTPERARALQKVRGLR